MTRVLLYLVVSFLLLLLLPCCYFPIGFVQSLSLSGDDDFDAFQSRLGKGPRRDNNPQKFVGFVPSRGQGRGIKMYYGSFGGASNCETCLVKARWLAEMLEVETLHVPACKRKPGDERAYPTMNPLEYFERESLRSCRRKDLGKESTMMDGDDDDDARRSFEGRSRRPTFEIESLERRITADEVNGMPCFEIVEGWCEIEKHRLGEYLIPKHKYKVEWKVTTSSLEKAREHAGEGKAIYFAGVYDFEPVDPETGKKYPNVWQKEAQRYVKGETQQLGWADEAVERRRKERDAVRAKKAAEAKENTNHRHNNNNNNNKSDDEFSVKQQSVPRKDMFLAQEQRIRQEQVDQQQQQEERHQISETTFREAWKENANRRRRRSRNLLAFSSIEPCLSNGNLNDEIYEEANKEIAKLQIEPSDTLCVHWRQEDFVWKKIGNEFVKNISYAAERIIHRAEAMKLNTVLLLTNDPEVYPEEKRHEGRVAVNTLRGMLHEIGGLRVEWSMHRNLPDRSKAIYIDKATCSMMVDFIGTGKSSFTATIMDMRQTHELCSINDPNAQLGKKSNSRNTKKGKESGTITDEEGDEEDLPPIKYKMCLKEKYGGSAKGDSSHDRSPFIFPVDELEHPIQAIETFLDIDATTPSNYNDNEQEEEKDENNNNNNKLVLKGGPEVVDEYLTEEKIHNFKLKEKAIEPGVEKLDHDEYVQEYEEENQKANAMKEFSVLDPSISAGDLKLDLRELDDDASVECDRCYAAMPQSEVAEPNAEIWLTTPSCEKCGIQLLKVRRKRLNLGNHEY